MILDPETFFLLPPLWHVGLIMLALLTGEALFRRHEYWAFPALAVYGTTWFWYYPDLNIRWEVYKSVFDPGEMDLALGQMLVFLGAFRWMLPSICRWCQGKEATSSRVPVFQDANVIFQILAFLWIILLSIGIWTHGKGWLHALFPIGSRSEWSFMFGRARIGGQWDWLISIAGYTYKIVVMLIGFTLFLPKKPTLQSLNILIIVVSLPYFMFVGTRTGFIEVTAPIALGLFFLYRIPMASKMTFLIWFMIGANAIMIIMLKYRNVGFDRLLETTEEVRTSEADFHDGANMLEEMMWMNVFLSDGSLRMNYGSNYVALLAQMIPRPLWPNKPSPGDDFTILRGFTSRGGQGGASGSVATGFIGQGLGEFGPIFGPLTVALFFALYCGWITRLWVQDHSLFRSFLALAAVVFIFNLGRGVTLLAIWPIIFGFVIIKFIEVSMFYSAKPTSRPVVEFDQAFENQGIAADRFVHERGLGT
jgi:hypothetical protein